MSTRYTIVRHAGWHDVDSTHSYFFPEDTDQHYKYTIEVDMLTRKVWMWHERGNYSDLCMPSPISLPDTIHDTGTAQAWALAIWRMR